MKKPRVHRLPNKVRKLKNFYERLHKRSAKRAKQMRGDVFVIEALSRGSFICTRLGYYPWPNLARIHREERGV